MASNIRIRFAIAKYIHTRARLIECVYSYSRITNARAFFSSLSTCASNEARIRRNGYVVQPFMKFTRNCQIIGVILCSVFMLLFLLLSSSNANEQQQYTKNDSESSRWGKTVFGLRKNSAVPNHFSCLEIFQLTETGFVRSYFVLFINKNAIPYILDFPHSINK